MLNNYLAPVPLIAILRGLPPADAGAVGKLLYQAGFRCIEVPLNSPSPYLSIAALRSELPDDCLVGAGTVLAPQQVDEVRAAGGGLIVMPHADGAVIRRAKDAGLLCTPGVATPTEGMAALMQGADAIKLFPAEQLPPQTVKAWRSVFPKQALFIPVGGIEPERMAAYWSAGANAFGIGSALYAPGRPLDQLMHRAQAFVAAARALAAPA
jgi:2-dehydro-3-deoxyphosphogalactonate aldolase